MTATRHATATWLAMAGTVLALLLRAAPAAAAAPLVPLMERCTPPIGAVADPSKGYGNYAVGGAGNWSRSLAVSFAWAYDSTADASAQAAIAATHRVEVCRVSRALPSPIDPGGEATVYCPGWHGDNAWVKFDTKRNIGGPPGEKSVATITEATTLAGNGGKASERGITVPYDWDVLDGNTLLVLVVNADKEPTSLADIGADITAGGFCGAPTRLAAKVGGPPQSVPDSTPCKAASKAWGSRRTPGTTAPAAIPASPARSARRG